MKIEFLYKDDTYKAIIEELNETLKLEEQEVTYTPVVQAGLNIFSFQKSGENEESAKILDGIKNAVLDELSIENLFIITDGISSYFCQRLYPLMANFERGLRRVLYIASMKTNDAKAIKLCKNIEKLEFAKIYEMLFSDDKYVIEAKKIVNSDSPAYSKQDILKKLNDISESSLWDKLFNGQYEYISKNFLDIKDGRNKIMHSRSISYAEFLTIKNTLSKSNKLFNEIEFSLLEKDSYDFGDIVNTIANALNRLGKAMVDIAANKVTNMFVKAFEQLAIEGMQNEETIEEIEGSCSDIVIVDTEEGSDSTDEEEEGLCLIN